jgi:uncharacterized protein YkwD
MAKGRVRKGMVGIALAAAVLGGAATDAGAEGQLTWKQRVAPEWKNPPPPRRVLTQKVDPAQKLDQDVRALVNAVRSTGTTCNGVAMPAVPALVANELLRKAAQGHSTDMATNDFMDHVGSNGSTFEQRAQAAGYTGYWSLAENVAAGQPTPQAVVDAWLASTDGHCESLMSSDLVEIGIASASNPNSTYGIYWTSMLGRR